MKKLMLVGVLAILGGLVSAREPLPAPGYFVEGVLGQPGPTPVEVSEAPLLPIAQESQELLPIPQEPQVYQSPVIIEQMTLPEYVAEPVDLYRRVREHHPARKDPCSVPTLISVPDPRIGRRGCTVCVEVCMPPCLNPEVCCSRLGNRVCYDFGKYKVHVTSILGVVHVDYFN